MLLRPPVYRFYRGPSQSPAAYLSQHPPPLLGPRYYHVAALCCPSLASSKSQPVLFALSSFSLIIRRGNAHCRYGEHSGTRSMQVQIIDALQLGKRDRASYLLSNLVNWHDSLKADDFVFILNYCAKSPDPLFVMETWRVMEEKRIDMNKNCFMSIIRALSKGGYLEEAFNWLTFLGGNHSTGPDLSIYNILLNGCAATRSPVHADYCLELMEGQLVGKSEITYCELLKLAVWQKNIGAVHQIWKDCTKYYSPSIIALRKVIWSFTRLGDLESAYDVLQHMVAVAFCQTTSVSASAEGRYRSSGLDIPMPTNNDMSSYSERLECSSVKYGNGLGENHMGSSTKKTEALNDMSENINSNPVLVNFLSPHLENRFSVEMGKCCTNVLLSLPSKVNDEGSTDFSVVDLEPECGRNTVAKEIKNTPALKVLRWSFNDVIHACAHCRNCDLAEQLFLQMQGLGLEPSQHTFDGFVKAVVSERGASYGMKVVKTMLNRNLKPYDTTLATLSVGCCRVLELDLAEALLDKFSGSQQRFIYAFNALLSACDAMDEPERAVQVLAKMKCSKIKSNPRTYELLYSLFGKVNAPYENGNMLSNADAKRRIQALEMDMLKNGVEHTHISMENLLKALGAEGMIGELLEYFLLAENRFYRTNPYSLTIMYNTVLHALVDTNEIHLAIGFFRKMKSNNIPCDAATYNIMIDGCSILRCYSSACALVSMMLQDGFFPKACTYTTLIKILLAEEDFEAALHLLDKASTEGIQPDVLLFNSILREASLKGHLYLIELIIERMHRERIQPDPSTCSFVFSAYVEQDFVSTAMEALQVLSLRMISQEENVLAAMRTNLEDLVLNEDAETESRIIEIFKGSEEYLATALLNLRWCAINGFSILWEPNKSFWARRLSSCYGINYLKI